MQDGNVYRSGAISFDMRWLWTALPGVCIVTFAFLEIFQDLFHPTLSGSFSDWVGRTAFRQFRRWPSALSLSGPLTLVVVILSWALWLAIGFAFIYWFAFPDGFQFNPSNHIHDAGGFWSMFSFSLEVLTTLGLGDVEPRTSLLRLLITFEALVGFALLTASVSSIILIYPALSRMRTLARRTEILFEAVQKTGFDVVGGNIETLIGDLARDLIEVRGDFIHFPIVYYFHSDRRRSSLAHALPDLLRLAETGSKSDAPDRVRLASVMLQTALEDLARLLSRRFIHAGTNEPVTVFRAYAEAHVLPPQQPD